MGRGATGSEGSSGENISHFTAIRFRITGSGNLQLKIACLDAARTNTLAQLPLSATTEFEPTRLCNFTSQRAAFEGWTSAIDEKFKINRMIIFSREVFTSYPG